MLESDVMTVVVNANFNIIGNRAEFWVHVAGSRSKNDSNFIQLHLCKGFCQILILDDFIFVT